MKHWFILIFAAAAFTTGCGNNSDQSSSKPGENPLNAPADYVGGLAKGQQVAVKTVDTAALSSAIQMFEATEGRYPKDLNELVSKKLIPAIPAPPRGMKFNYDATTGTVRVVPDK